MKHARHKRKSNMSSLSVRIHLDGEYISNIMYRNADMTVSIRAV